MVLTVLFEHVVQQLVERRDRLHEQLRVLQERVPDRPVELSGPFVHLLGMPPRPLPVVPPERGAHRLLLLRGGVGPLRH